MTDIWGFLLQTLTVSGAAVLLLLLKLLFRDKLSPRWQFSVWGALAVVALLPAGINGRYTLFRWQTLVEIIKTYLGDYSFTKVYYPVPFIAELPVSVADFVFVFYLVGVMFFILKYIYSYVGMYKVVRSGKDVSGGLLENIKDMAAKNKVKLGKVKTVYGVPSAFVCGVIRPVLVLPKNEGIDERIILHELMHIKNRDTLWSAVICFLRCLHWCNPLLIFCANKALNDMEARCDQCVLEKLEGEEIREYGHILLSMANERFSRTPASTSINNGGKNIKARIETIARFKKYPAGMELVSVCATLVLVMALAIGVRSADVYEGDSSKSLELSLAIARSTPCTTYAGAIDTYAKAVLEYNGYYRAMCAPEELQDDIFKEMKEKEWEYPNWNSGISAWPKAQSGYYVYNLNKVDKDTYECLLVLELNYPPDGTAEKIGMMYISTCKLSVEKERGRWVVNNIGEFTDHEIIEQSLRWGVRDLPGVIYEGIAGNIKTEVKVQTIHIMDIRVQDNGVLNMFGSSMSSFDTTPKPNGLFTEAMVGQTGICTHLGTEEERAGIGHLGLSVAPVHEDEKRPEKLTPAAGNQSGGSNTGESWASYPLSEGWGPTVEINGGGTGFDPNNSWEFPLYYAADLYVNKKIFASLDLYSAEVESE